MNHIFRLVWNRRLGVLQVASEFARGRTKGGRSAEGGARRAVWLAGVPLSLPLLAFAASPSAGMVSANAALTTSSTVAANALPTGGQVTSGAGQLAQRGDTLTVTQQSQNLALNWQTFNIGSQATVNFLQPGANAIAVNRIADTNGSQIFGHLNANGQVFLINPNGVLFGKSAQVNVGGLVASTLDVNDSALGTGSLTFSGTGKGSVTNLGTINVTGGGYAALLGNQVSNQGVIHAQLGSVALAGGSAITLNFGGDKLVSVQVDKSTLNALAQNGQLIEANGGNVWMTAGARDSLLASAVNNTGTIEAQTVQNQNGHIVLLGGMDAGTVAVGGTLDASAPNGGNGGQIETSAAKVQVADAAKITTAALLGLSGTWLIDPSDFTIAPGKSGTVSGGVPSGDISGATLGAALNAGNVVIQSSEGSTAGTGNVNVDDTVSWSSHTLTLDAQSNININGVMTASGTAGLALNYGGTNGSSSTTPTAGTSVNVGLGGAGFGGQVNFTGSNALSINGNSYTLINNAASLQGMSTSGLYALAGNLTLSGNFTPIGNSTTAFSGVFDGLGHTISGLTISDPITGVGSSVGLFGTSSGTIRNVGLVGGSVSGTGSGTSIGGLVGDNRGAISNAFTTGTVSGAGPAATGGGEWVGGLVGENETHGTISNAYAKGAVSGSSYSANLGGLVGTNYGTIGNAYATGAVSGSYGGTGIAADFIGGLVGSNLGTIQNAFATGNVAWTGGGATNTNSLGGLVGFDSNTSGPGIITDTYATGHVSSGDPTDTLGGLVGLVSLATGTTTSPVTGNYWDTVTSGQTTGTSSSSTFSTGMTGLNTAQMMQASNFAWTIATSSGSSDTWRIYSGNTTPLIESLLTPLTINASNQTVTYNATNQSTAVLSFSLASPDLSVITLGLTNAQHAGSYSENVASAYSTGYDLTIGTSSATLTVDPAVVTPSLTNLGIRKVYNGTTAAPTGFTPTFSDSGLISGDAIGLSYTGVAYNSAHVASATGVTVSGLSISSVVGSNGSLATDYTLASTSATAAATITAATLTASLSNTTNVSKTYDGTNAAPVGFAPTYSITGLLSGDSASLSSTDAAVFNSAHVASANAITLGGLSLASVTGNGTDNSVLSDYVLASSTASTAGGLAHITPATLTATAPTIGGTLTKTYDGNTAAIGASLVGGNISGAVAGDSLSFNSSGITLAYNSSHVASANSIGASGSLLFSITGSTNGSQVTDYSMASPTISSVGGTITPAVLTPTITNSGVTKTYDGTTAAPGGFTPTYTYAGLISGDTGATLTDSGAAYNNAHVAGASDVTVSGLGITGIAGSNGSQASDYTLASSSASVAATITPLLLTATAPTIGGITTKVYDGTTSAIGATLSGGSVNGALSGDSLTLDTSGVVLNYNSSHVATASSIGASGSLSVNIASSTNGSQSTDYSVTVPSIAAVFANITPVVLVPTLSNVGVAKTYDGTTAAPVGFSPTYSYLGFISGDTGASLSNTGAAYNSAHVASANSLMVSGLGISSITGANGSQASDYILATSSLNVAAVITPAVLTATLTNSGVTKTYDGTTAAPAGFTPTYAYAGLISGDTGASLTDTGAAYNNAHVASATDVTVSGLGISGITGSHGSQASDYTLASSSASVAATITPLSLTVTAPTIGGTTTKVYDGTTTATGASLSGGSVSGALSGDSLVLDTGGIALGYNSSHVAAASRIGASGSLSVDIASSTNGSQSTDYSVTLPSIASVVADIAPAVLVPILSNAGVTKTYDGTTAAPAGFTPTYSYLGFVSGDTGANLSNTGVAYNSAHVASANSLTVSGLGISGITGANGSQTTDYTLATSSLNVAAAITPATLTATLTNSGVTKTYDGTNAAPIGFTPFFSLTGLVSGDTGASLSNAGAAYNSAHVASATGITVSGLGIAGITGSDGSQAGDYTLASNSANVAATITPAVLTATLTNTGVTKVYDGTTNAPVGFTPIYSYTGLVSGDTGATLSDTGEAYNSAHVATAFAFTASGLGVSGITGSNSSQASDYTLSSSSASTAATITAAPVTVSLSNTTNVNKTYDGTTAAPSGFSPTYSFSGLVSGDSATVSSAAAPVFNSAHVASANAITQGGLSLATVTGNGTDNSVLGDYTLASTTASTGAGVASISPLVLTVTSPTIGGSLTKVYDGTSVATGASLIGGSINGAISGDSLLLNTSGIALDYNSSHVTSANSISVSGSVGMTIASSVDGSQSTDYILTQPIITSVAGTITPATLTVGLTNAGVTKTYDGTTAAPVGFNPTYSLFGFISGDTGASLSDTGVAYNSAHVASASSLTVSGLGIGGVTGSNGSLAGDYTLSSTSANVAATITPATLTATLSNTGVTKVYDGTTNAPSGFVPTYNYSGLVSGDTGATLTDTGAAYDSAQVLGASKVTVSGLGIGGVTGSDGSLASDYALAANSASVGASITPATLTASLTGPISKVYDGTTAATLASGNYALSGFVGGQGATVMQASGSYNSSNVAGAITVTATLGGSDFVAASGTDLSNYTLPTSASGAASITPASLVVTANNAGKTYDGIAYSGGQGVTYRGFVNGEGVSVLGGALTYGGNSQGAVNAGFYTLTPAGLSSSNYAISYNNGMLTVSPATLTASLVGTVDKVYDGSSTATLASGNYALSGVIGSDAVSLNDPANGAYATANAGSGIDVLVGGLTIGGAAAGNYMLANSTASAAIGTITPAHLTVTANNASTTYNAQPYSGGNGVTYSGFVDGQTAAVLQGTLSYGGSSQGAVNVGSYALTPGGLASNNYAITYNSGTLAIAPATLTYVATPVNMFTGQAIPPLTGTITGFQGGDSLGNATTGVLSFATAATAQSPAGQYAINGSGLAANDGNYVFVQAPGNASALDVSAGVETASPGVAYAQQLLGQPAPTGNVLPQGSVLVSAVATSDGASPVAVPLRSDAPAPVSDLYAPDVRVVGGGVRLPQ